MVVMIAGVFLLTNPMKKIKLLSLFCGVGGACEGYVQAAAAAGVELDIVGVDIRPQPNYRHTFVQADAIQYLREHGRDFDFIHASPPCQKFSTMSYVRGVNDSYPDLIGEVRDNMPAGTDYVIENVPTAPLRKDLVLDGTMFGLRTIRKRIFELSFFVLQPGTNRRGSHKNGDYFLVVGNFGRFGAGKAGTHKPYKQYKGSAIETAQEVMGMPWAKTHRELAQAIPPAYTNYIFNFYLLHHGN